MCLVTAKHTIAATVVARNHKELYSNRKIAEKINRYWGDFNILENISQKKSTAFEEMETSTNGSTIVFSKGKTP